MKIKFSAPPLISGHKKRGTAQGKTGLAGLLGLGAILVLLAALWATLGYGAYLKKIEQTGYFRQTLLRAAKFDFSFLENYAEGRLADFDEIKIDLKFKHLIRLHYLREQALKGDFISEAAKSEEFPAQLTYNGQTTPVKIGMTGKMVKGHLRNPSKWSLQVKAKGDHTIDGMKRFGLLIPESRGFLSDWLALQLLKDRGLIGLRSNLVNVSINGKVSGVFYLEERFDKHLIENNRLREGIIFKIEDDLKAYKEAKMMLNPDTKAQLLQLKRMWLDVVEGHLPPEQFFDMEKLAKLFAISDLMNNKHPLVRENLRFYFNPVTGLAEPIAREFQNVAKNDPAKLALFLEKPNKHLKLPRWHVWLSHDRVNRLIFDNLTFKQFYLQEATVISQQKFLDAFFAKHKPELDKLISRMYRMWPFYELPTQQLYDNQAYMRSVLFPIENEIIACSQQGTNGQIRIHLQNQQYLPLEVTHLSWQDSILCYPKERLTLLSKAQEGHGSAILSDFQLPSDFTWSKASGKELQLHYQLAGVEGSGKSVPVQACEHGPPSETPISNEKEGQGIGFAFIQEQGAKLFIPAGKWTLDRNLVIPSDRPLTIAAGAQIDLLNHAKIVSFSAISSNGTAERPVRFHSSDGTGEGLSIRQVDNSRSHFSYTQFTENRRAIDAYESAVTFYACTFSGPGQTDPFLTITHADAAIHQSNFENISTTALGCDGCTATITNTSFADIGGVGLKISGTTAEVAMAHVFMQAIGEQAISAAEHSQLDARWIEVRSAKVAVEGRNQSKIKLANAQIRQAGIAIHLHQTNSASGLTLMEADHISLDETEVLHQLEQGSILTLDGVSILAGPGGNKEKIYRAAFGKSNQ